MLEPLYDALATLFAFFYGLVHSYGVSIILLTITVGLLFFPLTAKSTRSMAAMSRLTPDINRIKAKHKNDRMAANQELQELFQREGINPMAGCLPMLIQMPVWFALFQVLQGLTHKVAGEPSPKYLEKSSELYRAIVRHGGELVSWGVDLSKSASQAMESATFGEAVPYFLLLGLMGSTQWFQQWRITSRNPHAKLPPDNPQAQMQQSMQRIMKYLPLVFTVISFSFPAALVLYWTFSNIFRIGQQELLFHTDPHRKKLRQQGTIEATATEIANGDTPALPATKPEPPRQPASKPKPKPAPGNGKPVSGRVTPAKSRPNPNRSKKKSKSRKGR